MKQRALINNKYGIHELPHNLPKNLGQISRINHKHKCFFIRQKYWHCYGTPSHIL